MVFDGVSVIFHWTFCNAHRWSFIWGRGCVRRKSKTKTQSHNHCAFISIFCGHKLSRIGEIRLFSWNRFSGIWCSLASSNLCAGTTHQVTRTHTSRKPSLCWRCIRQAKQLAAGYMTPDHVTADHVTWCIRKAKNMAAAVVMPNNLVSIRQA